MSALFAKPLYVSRLMVRHLLHEQLPPMQFPNVCTWKEDQRFKLELVARDDMVEKLIVNNIHG